MASSACPTESTDQQLASVKEDLEVLESLHEQITSKLQVLEKNIKEGLHRARQERPDEVRPIVQRLKGIVDSIKLDTTQLERCCKFLQEKVVCQANCYAEGTGLHVAMVGEAATATVYVVDQERREYRHSVDICCELVSSDGCSKVEGEVKKVKDGQYEISYRPQHRECHRLHIRVEGKHISGSPFPISVLRTTPTNIITDLKRPCGLALNSHGQLVVVERESHCISIFSSNGEKTSPFGSKGSDPGQLKHPSGVAISPVTGDILVCDKVNNRIQIFSPDGTSKRCIGTKGSAPLQFNYPVSIAVHPQSNKIFITDRDNHRVQILNADFTFCSIIDKDSLKRSGISIDIFDPYDISIDGSGYVYVTDRANHKVQVFTAEGKYTRQFGEKRKGEGKLDQPRGISIDSNDIVYIFEHNNYCISLFTRNGHFLRSFGTKGEQPGNFVYPNRIIVSKDGVIYISDTEGDCVQVF